MHIEIESENINVTSALNEHIHKEFGLIEKRWGERITRVRIYMKDVNGADKGGIDKQCIIESRPAGLSPVVSESMSSDAYDAVKTAVDKHERSLEHRLAKRGRARYQHLS